MHMIYGLSGHQAMVFPGHVRYLNLNRPLPFADDQSLESTLLTCGSIYFMRMRIPGLPRMLACIEEGRPTPVGGSGSASLLRTISGGGRQSKHSPLDLHRKLLYRKLETGEKLAAARLWCANGFSYP